MRADLAPPAHVAAMDIAIAVLTTGRRPESLAACLRSVRTQIVPPGVRLRPILVLSGASVPQLDRPAPGACGWRIVAEPAPGIPAARNRALDAAMALGCAHLAFIDDDATADPDWLAQLVAAQRRSGAAAVTGPQLPVFPPDAPAALRGAWIYRARQLRDGSDCRWAASNNVLFALDPVRRHGLRFDRALRSGGSDKAFFLRYAALGHPILWVAGAVVREPVVAERLTLGWALRRAWRLGTSGYAIERSRRGRAGGALSAVVKGCGYLGLGLATLPRALVPGGPGLTDALCHLAHGAGFFLGLSPAFRMRRYA